MSTNRLTFISIGIEPNPRICWLQVSITIDRERPGRGAFGRSYYPTTSSFLRATRALRHLGRELIHVPTAPTAALPSSVEPINNTELRQQVTE